MEEALTQSTERKIHDVLNYLWATTGRLDPKKFTLGVNWIGWKELGGTPKMDSIKFCSANQVFKVISIAGLPPGSVALIWL